MGKLRLTGVNVSEVTLLARGPEEVQSRICATAAQASSGTPRACSFEEQFQSPLSLSTYDLNEPSAALCGLKQSEFIAAALHPLGHFSGSTPAL